ncbi:hypothetical protein TNCV_220391 [Trichonephila clavipes]|nr:hypothetical protein TNCV_220391 [Trichonephila clavipes]
MLKSDFASCLQNISLIIIEWLGVALGGGGLARLRSEHTLAERNVEGHKVYLSCLNHNATQTTPAHILAGMDYS